MRTVLLFTLCLVTAGFCAAGQNGAGDMKQRDEKPGAPYWYSSETAPWYDSYGRLQHGYKNAPMKQYPSGREPYYYANETTPWYDSDGRLRYGPKNTETKPPPAGKEPYYYSSDNAPWYDSYGVLRYGPRGLTQEE